MLLTIVYICLEWTTPIAKRGADSIIISYNVFYSTTKEHDYWTTLSTNGNVISLHVKDLQPNSTYHFKVQAVSEPGVSVESDCHSVKPKPPPLTRPADKIIQICSACY